MGKIYNFFKEWEKGPAMKSQSRVLTLSAMVTLAMGLSLFAATPVNVWGQQNSTQACCLSDESCQEADPIACVHDLGGSAWGAGTDCSAVDCSEAETACNGEDDDDDGLIDEGFNIGVACSLQGTNGCWTSGIFECNEAGSGAACVLNGPAAQPSPRPTAQRASSRQG